MLSQLLWEEAGTPAGRVDFAPLRGASVLVTGATGLIGCHLLTCLCRAGGAGFFGEVVAQSRSGSPDYLAELWGRFGVRSLALDLAAPASYGELPRADVIVHAAGYATPARFTADPLATLQLNTGATVALARRLNPGGRFLFVGSSELYSGLEKERYVEEDVGRTGPDHPRAAYIEGKRGGEVVVHALRARGVRAATGRVSLAYGPGTRPGDPRALNAFVERALTDGKIRLQDSGTAVRTYCYVTDVVEMLWAIVLRGQAAVYNVGGVSQTTIRELAETISAMVGVPVVVPAGGAELAGAPPRVQLDLGRVRDELGKTEWVGWEEGLRRTIAWQRAVLGRG